MTQPITQRPPAIAAQRDELDWNHLGPFWRVVSNVDALAEDVQASIYAAKATPRGSPVFHEKMRRLRAELRNMKEAAEKFEMLADEYERGVHR